jgi:hypothetical protein
MSCATPDEFIGYLAQTRVIFLTAKALESVSGCRPYGPDSQAFHPARLASPLNLFQTAQTRRRGTCHPET